MKHRIVHLLALMSVFVAMPAFADTATAIVSPEPADPFHMVLNSVVPAILTALAAFVAWVSKHLKTWIVQKASEANTKESAAWYGTALMLAGIAVRAAEAKYGPDTDRGQEKADMAADWLKNRLLAIDPKLKIKDSDIRGFVHAAYAEAFGLVTPLVSGPKSSGPSVTSNS